MPKVRLRWLDRGAEGFDVTGSDMPASMVLPDGKGGDAFFNLVNNPEPPDPEGLPVYQERPAGDS